MDRIWIAYGSHIGRIWIAYILHIAPIIYSLINYVVCVYGQRDKLFIHFEHIMGILRLLVLLVRVSISQYIPILLSPAVDLYV